MSRRRPAAGHGLLDGIGYQRGDAERYLRLCTGGLATGSWSGATFVVTAPDHLHERLRAQFAVVYPRLSIQFGAP